MKKIIAALMTIAILASPVHAVQTQSKAPIPVRVPVLMYHSVEDQAIPGNGGVVSSAKFESDMKTLKEAGYEGIFFQDLENYLRGRGTLPKKPIMIIFDDGYENNYTHAFPIAKAYGMKFTVSIVGWSINIRSYPSIPEYRSHFGFEEMKRMRESKLVDFQNHTYDLHSKNGLSQFGLIPVGKGVLPMAEEKPEAYKHRLSADLSKLNRLVRKELGYTPRVVVYPFGAYTKHSDQIAKSIGFTGSVTVRSGVRTYKTVNDLWKIPRINVPEELAGAALIQAIEATPAN